MLWIDNLDELEAIPFEQRVIFLANPNNPDGLIDSERRIPAAKYVCQDRVYDIPKLFFLPSQGPKPPQGEEIDLFSTSKYLGFAGARCGYAFVRKSEEASDIIRWMREYIDGNSLGITTDGQVKCLQGLQKVLDNPRILREVGDRLRDRFRRLKRILSRYSPDDIRLESSWPIRVPYAWIWTRYVDARQIFLECYLIRGRSGREFFSTPNYIRFNIMAPHCVFEEFLHRLKRLEFPQSKKTRISSI
jgi:aspartate/methionine/tyrosine aminotransferase